LPLRRLRRLALREPRLDDTVEFGRRALNIGCGSAEVPAPRFGNRITLYEIRFATVVMAARSRVDQSPFSEDHAKSPYSEKSFTGAAGAGRTSLRTTKFLGSM
jgi:hypothetical protein